MSDSNNRQGDGDESKYGAQGGSYYDGNGGAGRGGQAPSLSSGGGGFKSRFRGSGAGGDPDRNNVTPLVNKTHSNTDNNNRNNHNHNNVDGSKNRKNNKKNNKKNTGKDSDLGNKNYSNASGDRNNYGANHATPMASSGQLSSQSPPARKRLDYSKMQPTVEDVPDEDDRKSSVSGGSVIELEAGMGTSNSSMSGGGEPQRGSAKQEQAEPLSGKKRKPVTIDKRTQSQNEPKKETVKRTPTKSRGEQKRPVDPPRTPEQQADDTPEIAPRKSMPYASAPNTGKREEVARVADHLNTAVGGSKGTVEERRSTPYTYTPTKKEPENSSDLIKDRERTPYASGGIKPERTKSSASTTGFGTPDDPILVRKPAPYSQAYGDRNPPCPMPSSQKSGYRPSQESLTSQRKPSQYSYIPSKPNASSESSGTPMKRQASKGRAEARSRPSTPSGNRTPKEYRGEGDYSYDDPIIAKIKEGAERRSPAPYAYSPQGSISSATSHKMQNSPSQGSYSQIPQNLQSTGNLRPTSSPTASYTSTGSAHGHYPHVASPQPAAYPPPHPLSPPVSTADGVKYPPYAPDPGDFSNVPHPQYNFPYQQSPTSYFPVATPMWVTETDPGPPCPESTQIPWGTWYHPPYAPKFTICEGCYRKYISFTPFAPHFTRIDILKPSISGNGVIPQKTVLRACMFHSSLTRQLWQNMCKAQSVQQQQNYNYQQSAGIFYAYAQKRAEMVTCAGPMGVKPHTPHSQWPRWWACPNYLPTFLICEACFVDYMDIALCIPPDKASSIPPAVCTSPYMQFFQPYTMEMYVRQNPATNNGELPVWVCDVGSNMLIKHLLEEANKPLSPGLPQGNWDHFVRLAAWRLMDAKPCPGHQANEQSDQALVMGGGRRWYRCTKDLGKADLVVCEACFYDMLVPANISHEFVEMWVSGHEIQPHCHLSMMEYRFPLSMAKETKDYSIFWDAAAWGLGLRKCDDRGYVLGNTIAVTAGVHGGVEWYVLFAGPEEDADVLMECCPRCYHTFIKPSTFGDHFDHVLVGMIIDRGNRNGSAGQLGSSTSTVLEDIPLRICDLISFPQSRWQRIFFKLLEAAHQRDFTILSSWLRTSARLTPCARDGVVYKPSSMTMGTGGQRWYSMPGEGIEDTIVACEECYHGLVRRTALETFFSDITEGIIQHLSDPMVDGETVLLCSLYSQRQRELLDRCLFDLRHYRERADDIVAPLVQASINRYREFIDIRGELQELEEERMAVSQAQMAGLRLDNERNALNRSRDLEKRVADLHARWKEIE